MQSRIVRIVVVVSWLAFLAAGGCELVADFDRSQIPGNRVDSGVIPMTPLPDAGPGDASVDSGDDDAGDDDAGR